MTDHEFRWLVCDWIDAEKELNAKLVEQGETRNPRGIAEAYLDAQYKRDLLLIQVKCEASRWRAIQEPQCH